MGLNLTETFQNVFRHGLESPSFSNTKDATDTMQKEQNKWLQLGCAAWSRAVAARVLPDLTSPSIPSLSRGTRYSV